jgi:hypothetical protein
MALHYSALLAGVFLVWLFLCILVARTAYAFHRPPAAWVILAVLFSPLIMLATLYIIGDPQETAALQDKEDRLRQLHPERTDIREAALNEMNCPHCGAAVNPITEDGLHSSEKEPWLLICNQCQGRIEPDA